MDCDLVEVSGQMVLPLPNLDYPQSGTRRCFVGRFGASHRAHRPNRAISVCHSPPDFQHRTPMVRAGTGMVAGAGAFAAARHGVSSQRSIAR